MTGKRNPDSLPPGERLARLAASQHGVVSRAQLRRLGFSEHTIERDARTGRLHRLHRGVYAVGHTAIGDLGRMRAATLACGKNAVVSHRTAAALLGLLDVAAVEAAASRPTRGVGAARALAAEWRNTAPESQRLKSPLEATLLPLLANRGIAPPRTNAPVRLPGGRTIEVDFLWRKEKLVVEADSRDFHATPVAFERDRWRDRELMRAGYSTLRVTRRQVEREPEAIAQAVASSLARGGVSEARDLPAG